MTVEEVARLLRVSERTVYKWSQSGEVPAAKFGATWRFSRERIQQWMDQRFQDSAAKPHPSAEVAHDLAAVWRAEDTVFCETISKAAALERLVAMLGRNPAVQDQTALAAAISHREDLMSTGIGGGLAVPHARLPSVSQPAVAALLSRAPIADYASIDNQPVRIVFMIAAGAGQHSQHIRLLNDIASIVRDAALREAIYALPDARSMHHLLTSDGDE